MVVCFSSFIKRKNRLIQLTALLAVLFSALPQDSRYIQVWASNSIPAPPEDIRERFGIYNWNVNTRPFPNDGSTDRLNWGADKVAELGVSTIRIAMPATDIYQVLPPGTTDLVDIAKSPAFDKLLRDPRFKTILLTAYTLRDMASNWSDGYTQAEYDAEKDEIKRLGEYLLTENAFSGKTFIILNWEGDNAVFFHNNKRTIWDAYTEWIRSRNDGVRLARQMHPESGVRLFSGLEFNTVTSYKTGKPCGTPVDDPVRTDPLQNRCVIDYVAPRVEVDYYSYSAWRGTDGKLDNPGESLKDRLKSDLNFALSLIRSRRPEINPENFILGEFGFERARYGECNAANYVNEVFNTALDQDGFHVSYAIFWQIMDNAPFLGVDVEYFGLYRYRNGQFSLTLPGETFKNRIAGLPVTNYSGCPQIRRAPPHWGVLNSIGTTDFRLNPDSVISVYVKDCCQNTDTPFSATNNVVHFDQTSNNYNLPRDNNLFFYESQTQINFSMPPGRRPGMARVYVTNAEGIDSNSQTINIQCNDCPQINDPYGVLDTDFQTLQIEPGQKIAISGSSFSDAGNIVAVEQFDKNHNKVTWLLFAPQISQQAAGRIEVTLPVDLFEGQNASLFVTNSQGRESNELVFTVSTPCAPCAPRLKPFQAINSRNDDFLQGTPVTILGRYDNTAGISVVIEQVDSNFKVYRTTISEQDTGWSASNSEIRFNLPYTLFPGRALMYVVDASGRESRAQDVIISPGTVTVVSSATFLGSAVALDSIATAFGNPLAPATESAQTLPLPTELGSARVKIKDSAGKEAFAPLFFVSPTQINFHVPPELATGKADITFINGYGSESYGEINLVTIAPGLFTVTADGKGYPAGQLIRVTPSFGTWIFPLARFDESLNQWVPHAINLGVGKDQNYMILYGTGIRGAGGTSAITATVGGVPTEVLYAGPQNTFIGLDQINLNLTQKHLGLEVAEVKVFASGIESNTVVVEFVNFN